MGAREVFAFTAGPLVLAGIVWLPSWFFLTILAAVALVATDELLVMARSAGHSNRRRLAVLLGAAVMAAGWVVGPVGLSVAVVGVLLVVPVAQLTDRRAPAGGLDGSAVTAFAVLYIAASATCLGWLRTMPGESLGWRFVLLFLITIWIGDSGAYYVGRMLGRHKMSPRISPNKTWEGLAGGVLASVLATAILNLLLGLDLDWWQVAAWAAVLAVAAPVGDLVESLFKRDTGVKDSSALIPGHGGFLDRTDSLFFAAPFALGLWLAMST